LRTANVEQTIVCLKEVIKTGYPSEADLFIVRLVYEYLVRNHDDGEGLAQAKKVQAAFSDVKSTLLNSIEPVLESIEMEDFVIFKHVVGIYTKEYERDPQMIEYVDRVAKYYFGSTVRKQNMMQEMMKNMMAGKMPKLG